jgi:hypothetical protein
VRVWEGRPKDKETFLNACAFCHGIKHVCLILLLEGPEQC